jgi:hypothetical protein
MAARVPARECIKEETMSRKSEVDRLIQTDKNQIKLMERFLSEGNLGARDESLARDNIRRLGDSVKKLSGKP